MTEGCSCKRWVTEHYTNILASTHTQCPVDIPFKYPYKFLMGTQANVLIVFDVLIVVAFVNSIFPYLFYIFDSGGKEVSHFSTIT